VRRAVADTNVYVSALAFGGVADEVLARGRRRDVTLVTSPPILREIEGVLRTKFRWSRTRTLQAIALIRTFTEVVHPTEAITAITDDEPDNRILECAVAAQADVIVTGDKHLQALRGIAIVSPRAFLERAGP
jgi:putative PIN family toxin of toxin-antitoxin system